MNECRIISADEIKISEWSGGTTSELFIYPENAVYADRDFEVRVSTATVDAESCEFTSLPAYKRHIMTLEGFMRLCHENHHEAELAPYQTDVFSGEWRTKSYGKCVDFNLMHTRDWDGSISAISGNCLVQCESGGITAVYARRNGIEATVSEPGREIVSGVLNTGDFLVVKGESVPERDVGAKIAISGISGSDGLPMAVLVRVKRKI